MLVVPPIFFGCYVFFYYDFLFFFKLLMYVFGLIEKEKIIGKRNYLDKADTFSFFELLLPNWGDFQNIKD